MNYKAFEFGDLYAIFLENELIFGFARGILSIKLDCRDFEYDERGIVLYGSEPNGLLRSRNVLLLSDKPCFRAMHDSSGEIKALNGRRIIPKENGDSYLFTCVNGEKSLTLSLAGNCRCDGNVIYFRRGETKISLSEPTVWATHKRYGFKYEAERCMSLLSPLTSDSELLPLLLLVDGLENAVFNERRAEMINKLVTTMSEQNKKTAEDIIRRYYRAFGIEKR